MVRYISHKQIDKFKWDDCINNAVNGSIYSYSWYLDIVCEGWDALVNEDYSTVMPITKGRKYLMDYIFPPFFTQQLGIFSKYNIDENVCTRFLNAIPTAYRFIEMNLNVQNKWVPSSFSIHKNTNFILMLDKPYEEVKNGYSDHHKRNINKAIKNNLSLNKNEKAEVIIEMFRQNKGRLIANLKTIHYNKLLELVKQASKFNMTRVWSVIDENDQPCAGAIFFESHESSIFIFSGTTSTARENAAMYFLLDQYFREFSKQIRFFDFEGSNNPDLGRFYKGFGSTDCVYLQIKKNQLPPPWNWFKN